MAHLDKSGLCEILQSNINNLAVSSIENTEESDVVCESIWKSAYDEQCTSWRKQQIRLGEDYLSSQCDPIDMVALIRSNRKSKISDDTHTREPQVVMNREEIGKSSQTINSIQPNVLVRNERIEIDAFAISWNLNEEQTLAFKLVANKENTFNSDPLRMYLTGPAGTGKSRVFNTLKAYFDEKNEAQ